MPLATPSTSSLGKDATQLHRHRPEDGGSLRLRMITKDMYIKDKKYRISWYIASCPKAKNIAISCGL